MFEEVLLNEVGDLDLVIDVVGHAELGYVVDLLCFEFHILECIFEIIQIHD